MMSKYDVYMADMYYSTDIRQGEVPAAGWPGNNFITERFCWKEASKAAWVSEAPDIGDIGPSGPPAISHLL